MRCMQKRRKYMAIKIDLEKAYDRVRWEFIDASLKAAGIPDFLWNVIMFAITSSSMQVLWNGILIKKFCPVRGIHQGCPLSLYLFVLCIEWLGHSIKASVNSGVWRPIRLSWSGSVLSHLLFANDLFIIGHANIDHVRRIKAILEEFCGVSDHKINARKSNVFFSNVIDEQSKERLEESLGFRLWQILELTWGCHSFMKG